MTTPNPEALALAERWIGSEIDVEGARKLATEITRIMQNVAQEGTWIAQAAADTGMEAALKLAKNNSAIPPLTEENRVYGIYQRTLADISASSSVSKGEALDLIRRIRELSSMQPRAQSGGEVEGQKQLNAAMFKALNWYREIWMNPTDFALDYLRKDGGKVASDALDLHEIHINSLAEMVSLHDQVKELYESNQTLRAAMTGVEKLNFTNYDDGMLPSARKLCEELDLDPTADWMVNAKRISDYAVNYAASLTGGWRTIESAPKDETRILLGKFVGHPDHATSCWWVIAGRWSLKWKNWNDGVEPCGLAGPTHWMEIPKPWPLPTSPADGDKNA